jgi:hypothetical protein
MGGNVTTLFDLPPLDPRVVTNAAVKRVERHADPDWMVTALEAVRVVCLHSTEFTSDDVWKLLDLAGAKRPHEARAFGAVMRRAKTEGLIEPTERFIPSKRVELHQSPRRVWRVL